MTAPVCSNVNAFANMCPLRQNKQLSTLSQPVIEKFTL